MSSAISQSALRSNPPRIVVAGTHSGAGKTTVTLGIQRALAQRDTILCLKGEIFRGHEFHYSTLTPTAPVEHAFVRTGGRMGASMPPDGFVVRNVLASYTHAHFGSNPWLPQNLIEVARRCR